MSKYSKIFFGRYINGKFKTIDQDRYDRFIEKIEGKDILQWFEKPYKQRTLPENRYLFGIVISILQNETEDFGGWESIEVYRWLEFNFLNNFPTGLPRQWILVKQLDTISFEQLMDRIREWAAMEYGIYIPLPNESLVTGEIIL